MRRLTLEIVLVAFIFSCGGQWYALQAVAWASMIRDYSKTVPFTKAVEMTLSGEYPCMICKAIAERKKSTDDRITQLSKQETKIISKLLVVPTRLATGIAGRIPAYTSWQWTHCEAPPVPPPRCA